MKLRNLPFSLSSLVGLNARQRIRFRPFLSLSPLLWGSKSLIYVRHQSGIGKADIAIFTCDDMGKDLSLRCALCAVFVSGLEGYYP